jgi:protein-S-isoprenylcysteine O-methyltransferase Ste14
MTRTFRVAVWILIIIAGSLALVFWSKNPAPLAFATVAAGILTFFHLLAQPPELHSASNNQDKRLRAAIASAIVVQYLVLVGLVAYFTNSEAFGILLPITQTLLASFTATVGAVIAFYFGTSAYVEGKRIENQSSPSHPNDPRARLPNDA